jgi:predicted polyphosphate/ATP-dependent NAD kinase
LTTKKKLGFIVNPVAGIGGRVGLKGSDGEEILEKALQLGAVPTSPARAIQALKRIALIRDIIDIVTCSREMGENEARECGFGPRVIYAAANERTSSADTVKAAEEMAESRVALLLFAGGDGTARDIYQAVNQSVPVLGIPTGVKIHSAVFAVTPRSAGDLAVMYLQGMQAVVREAEVMDVDEQAFRENRVSSRLYGYLRVPYEKTLVQSAKAAAAPGEESAAHAIANDIVDNMEGDCVYIIGPGTTTRPIMERLGLRKTLLGVDAVYKHQLLGSDLNEAQLLQITKDRKSRIIVSVIGNQGFILGRGNQQLGPELIKKTGRENIIVVATPSKLASLRGAPLLVDTGDNDVDKSLTGYIKVITGYGRSASYKVESR